MRGFARNGGLILANYMKRVSSSASLPHPLSIAPSTCSVSLASVPLAEYEAIFPSAAEIPISPFIQSFSLLLCCEYSNPCPT